MRKKAFIFIIFCLLVVISACGGLSKVDGITSVDFFSGISCDIPHENLYSSWPYAYYHTNEPIEELKSKLEKSSDERNDFSVESLTENSLLVEFSENETRALFIIKEFNMRDRESQYQYHYCFSDFSTHLYTSTETKEYYDIAQMQGIPLPWHLLGVEAHGTLTENKEIPVTGTIDDFEKFYQYFQQVYPDYPIEVERIESKLILKNVPVEFNYTFDKDGKKHFDSMQIDQIEISFVKNSNHDPVIIISCCVGE